MPERISVSLYEKNRGQRNVEENSDNYKILRYPCSSSIQTCTPYVVSLSRGTYQLELFGASGGFPNNDPKLGGHGSYTKGNLVVDHDMKLYVYLGQQGKLNGPRTFNGGGRGSANAGSGGGSSDIRLIADQWDNFDSLKSRIMVAAGGVGGHLHAYFYTGTHGGNLTGVDGILTSDPSCNPIGPLKQAYGATQNRGGIGGIGESASGKDGKFGTAGDPVPSDYTSGGSGGYFGGAGSSISRCHVGIGSSGSSFISGHKGCNAILNTSTSQDNIHLSNQNIHYSGIKFSSTIIKS